MGRSVAATGLTLLEMLVALALVSVLLTLAVPSFSDLAAATAARVDAGRLLASLHFARSHAVLQATSVTLCPRQEVDVSMVSADSRCGASFDSGWMVTPASASGALPRALRVEAGPAYAIRQRDGVRPVQHPLVFRADGTTGRGATYRFCLPQGRPGTGWRVVVSATGRPRLDRDAEPCMAGGPA